MTFLLTIETKRFLRKPKVELFKGAWSSPMEVEKVVAKFRPKARILSIEEITTKNWTYEEIRELEKSVRVEKEKER